MYKKKLAKVVDRKGGPNLTHQGMDAGGSSLFLSRWALSRALPLWTKHLRAFKRGTEAAKTTLVENPWARKKKQHVPRVKNEKQIGLMTGKISIQGNCGLFCKIMREAIIMRDYTKNSNKLSKQSLLPVIHSKNWP